MCWVLQKEQISNSISCSQHNKLNIFYMMMEIDPASETPYFNQNEKTENAKIMCQLALSLL